ncbi:hypothetical protein Ahia01_001052900 [Argonauta hians]
MSDNQNLTNLKMFKNIKKEFCEIFDKKRFSWDEIKRDSNPEFPRPNINYHDEIFKVLYRYKGNEMFKSKFQELLMALHTSDNHKLVQLINSYPFIGNKPYGIALIVFDQKDNEQVTTFNELLNNLGFNVLCIEGTNGSTDKVQSSLEKADFGGVYMLFDLTMGKSQVLSNMLMKFSEKPKLIVTYKISRYGCSNAFFIKIPDSVETNLLTNCLIKLFKSYKTREDIYLFEEFAQNLNTELQTHGENFTTFAYWCPKVHLIFPKFSVRITNKLGVNLANDGDQSNPNLVSC